jgi:hypothetical protein
MEIAKEYEEKDNLCCAHAMYYYAEKDLWLGDCGVAITTKLMDMDSVWDEETQIWFEAESLLLTGTGGADTKGDEEDWGAEEDWENEDWEDYGDEDWEDNGDEDWGTEDWENEDWAEEDWGKDSNYTGNNTGNSTEWNEDWEDYDYGNEDWDDYDYDYDY